MLGIATDICERQHHDGQDAALKVSRAAPPLFAGAKPIPDHGIGPHRTGDILEVLLAQIGELNPDLASDLIVSRRRDADAAGFCDALKPRRDVNVVSEDVMRLDNHVADIDAHAESNAPVFRIADCNFL